MYQLFHHFNENGKEIIANIFQLMHFVIFIFQFRALYSNFDPGHIEQYATENNVLIIIFQSRFQYVKLLSWKYDP